MATPIKVENYDGEKFYLKEEKFRLIKLKRVHYFIQDDFDPFEGVVPKTYKVVRAQMNRNSMDCAKVKRVEDEGILAKLLEKALAEAKTELG